MTELPGRGTNLRNAVPEYKTRRARKFGAEQRGVCPLCCGLKREWMSCVWPLRVDWGEESGLPSVPASLPIIPAAASMIWAEADDRRFSHRSFVPRKIPFLPTIVVYGSRAELTDGMASASRTIRSDGRLSKWRARCVESCRGQHEGLGSLWGNAWVARSGCSTRSSASKHQVDHGSVPRQVSPWLCRFSDYDVAVLRASQFCEFSKHVCEVGANPGRNLYLMSHDGA